MSIKKIRVLVVDDSALVRQILVEVLNAAPDVEVVGTASDPFMARERIKELNPDVLTLDVEMPRMDGLTFLANLMRLRPMPVVMVSSLTEQGAETTLKALELGAIDFVSKPKIDVAGTLAEFGDEILGKIRMAAGARVMARSAPVAAGRVAPKYSADAVLPASGGGRMLRTTDRIIAIGASTGGTEAIREVLTGLPADCPAIVIAQHIPEAFSLPFTRRMDSLAAMSVVEPVDGQYIMPGHVYIAPGGQTLVSRARRRAISLPSQQWPARQSSLPERGRAVPLRGAERGAECRGSDPHRHGRRRRARAQGNARRGSAHDRAGRGVQHGVGNARSGGETRWRAGHPAAQPRGRAHHAIGGDRGGAGCDDAALAAVS